MSIAVFPLNVQLPYSHGITFINHTETMGDGFRKAINKNLAFGPRADGNGNLTSYAGINSFTITLAALEFATGDATKAANIFWQFYKDRKGSFEAFYFYDLNEVGSIDLRGINQTGRYLVKFKDDYLTRESIVAGLMKAGVTLEEVRS